MTCRTAPDEANVTIRKQLDFLVISSAAKSAPEERAFDIQKAYTAAVGRAPQMPSWGSQYWHCKNRYANQTQLLTAARYFHENNLSVGVLVIDWFHWKVMGDWSFDPKYWPVESNLPPWQPRICSGTLMGYPMGRSTPSVFSRGGSLLPSSYADVRSPDDVIAF